jgi:hypothetical protein
MPGLAIKLDQGLAGSPGSQRLEAIVAQMLLEGLPLASMELSAERLAGMTPEVARLGTMKLEAIRLGQMDLEDLP